MTYSSEYFLETILAPGANEEAVDAFLEAPHLRLRDLDQESYSTDWYLMPLSRVLQAELPDKRLLRYLEASSPANEEIGRRTANMPWLQGATCLHMAFRFCSLEVIDKYLEIYGEYIELDDHGCLATRTTAGCSVFDVIQFRTDVRTDYEMRTASAPGVPLGSDMQGPAVESEDPPLMDVATKNEQLPSLLKKYVPGFKPANPPSDPAVLDRRLVGNAPVPTCTLHRSTALETATVSAVPEAGNLGICSICLALLGPHGQAHLRCPCELEEHEGASGTGLGGSHSSFRPRRAEVAAVPAGARTVSRVAPYGEVGPRTRASGTARDAVVRK